MEVNGFVRGLASDLDHRCERLQTQLSEHMPHPDVVKFHQNTINRLCQIQRGVRALLNSGMLDYHHLWGYALSDYQGWAREVAIVEQFAMPVLLRYDDRDHRGFQMVLSLTREIGYPDELMPTVITTSDQYYWAQPELRIVGMPAGDLEGGVLGWPDLLHELAHVLQAAWPAFVASFTPIVNAHFRNQRDRLADLGSSDENNRTLAIAQIKWGEKQEGTWRVELAADLIATYLVGPAYGWQHVRLSISHGDDPYYPGPGDDEGHPADQARLDGVLAMLKLLKMKSEADAINTRWSEMLDIRMYRKRPAGYELYYPPVLLQKLAETVFVSCQKKGLVPFMAHQGSSGLGLVGLIDQAWRMFGKDPAKYPQWERQAINQLRCNF
jgi:hypothetical protein